MGSLGGVAGDGVVRRRFPAGLGADVGAGGRGFCGLQMVDLV
jgi:hypothetical protein